MEDLAATGLTSNDFYRKRSHGAIYDAACRLVDRGEPPDFLAVEAELQRTGRLDEVGGMRIRELVTLAPPTSNAPHHARLIIAEAKRRKQLGRLNQARDAVLNGGLEGDTLAGLVDLVHETGADALAAVPMFALTLTDFLAQEEEIPDPLLGDQQETVIPAGGLIIVAGKPGVGKTTLVLDGVFHLASGREWLGLQCPRPLRVLIIENEGPSRLFRRKLEEKKAAWQADLPGELFVQTWRWGSFSLADAEAHLRLRSFLEEQAVDLVVGDPLGTLGVEGVGSPDDTRRFVAMLIELGLFQSRAFLFLHHFRKETAAEETDQISGSWGGHLDTLIVMKPRERAGEVRLSFPKMRWAERERTPMIIGRVPATRSFEYLGDEGDAALLEPALSELLADGTPRPLTEIASAKKGGIGAAPQQVLECLEQNDHLFAFVTGEEAKQYRPKARKDTKLWSLRSIFEGSKQVKQLSERGAQPHIPSPAPEEAPLKGGSPDGAGAGPGDVDEQGELLEWR